VQPRPASERPQVRHHDFGELGAFEVREAGQPGKALPVADREPAERRRGADLGIAWDGDADRCFVVDERGETKLQTVLRVFGGANPASGSGGEGEEVENGWVASALQSAAPTAERAGVTIALETHDAFSSAWRTPAVLDAVDSTHIGAIWDSHHPYRVGESPAQVIAALGAHQDAREDLNSAACRHRSGDDPELGNELIARARQLHSGSDHYVCINHLNKPCCST